MRKYRLLYSLVLFFFVSFSVIAQCNDKGSIVISEIYFDTRFSEEITGRYHHFGEYIELFNSSDEAIDLKDWVIEDNHTAFKIGTTILTKDPNYEPNTIIQPGGFKIITFSSWHASQNIDWYSAEQGWESPIDAVNKFVELFPQALNHEEDIILQNTMVLYNLTDKVSLYNSAGRLIHEISYFNGGASQDSALDYMGIDEFSIDTETLNVWINNGDGGVFQGAIGEVNQLDPNTGEPILDQAGSPITFQSGLYQTSIYLTDEYNYYFNKSKVIQIGQATPFTIPYTIELLPVSPDLFSPPGTSGFNWIHSIAYDISSQTNDRLSESRVYYDDLAKPLVSLSKDFQNNVVWATETTYDSFARQYQTSFPSIVCNVDFEKTDMLSNPLYRTDYLDYYYGDTNTENEFQATATHPYIEIEYDKLNPGNVIRVYGGNQIGGEWKTGYSFTMPAAQEMYYAFGYDYYNGDVTTNGLEEVVTKFYKTVSIDPHGVEGVVFTDGEGKTLAAARSTGSTVSYPVISTIGTQGFVDVYIPSGVPDGTFLTSSSDYTIYDLKTGNVVSPTPSSLPSGNAYRVVANTIPSTDYKTFINLSNGVVQAEVGALGIQYNVNYYNYTLNYYDKTNRLYKMIQPNGFDITCINSNQVKAVPNHTFATTFSYNTLGQLVETTSPDEGTSKFAYRKDGQIRFSQSALQVLNNQVSYTDYDQYARPIESGVITGYAWNSAVANVDASLPYSSVNYSDRTYSVYDYVGNYTGSGVPFMGLSDFISGAGLNPNDYIQHNLAGNVVETYNDISRTWYSYDIYGRVEWMVQNLPDIGIKTVHYQYDARGQIKKVIYQQDKPSERFVHQYTYNYNGALTKVETSKDNINFETHADYEYYIDGKLKRVELAEGIQGLDYVYTLGGMLKSINHPSLKAANDPGGDDNDVFGITLDYYSGDYIRPSKPQFASAPTVPGINQDQYDGNIKAIRWSNTQLDNAGLSPKAYAYSYNQNKWLSSATFGSFNFGTNTITPLSQYAEGGLSYDANGNIRKLRRTDDSGSVLDNLKYLYKPGTNQLDYVNDNVVSSATDDIEGQMPNNYQYNAIGQLIRNESEDLDYFYNVQGLTTEVRKSHLPVIKFYYNERGERIKKESFSGSTLQSTDYYVLDASGNTLGVYTKTGGGSIALTEIPVYGGNRLGVFNYTDNSTNYQITDHLGNVRAVIKKLGTAPSLQQYADYYPFGEQLPLRNSMAGYRYAYQGQEKDGETGMEAFKLRLWDGRIGRWLNPDPKGQFFSPYLGMGNNPVSMIDPDGGQTDDFYRNLDTNEISWFEGSGEITGYEHLGVAFTFTDAFNQVANWGESRFGSIVSWSKEGGFIYHNNLDEVILTKRRGNDILPRITFNDNNPRASWGMTTPPAIFTDTDAPKHLIQHENGHGLQFVELYKKYNHDFTWASLDYYYNIGIPSFINGVENNIENELFGEVYLTVDHDFLDVEVDANHRAVHHYGENLDINFKKHNSLTAKEPNMPFYKRWFYYWLFSSK